MTPEPALAERLAKALELLGEKDTQLARLNRELDALISEVQVNAHHDAMEYVQLWGQRRAAEARVGQLETLLVSLKSYLPARELHEVVAVLEKKDAGARK